MLTISSCGLVKMKKVHNKQEIMWSSSGNGLNGSEVLKRIFCVDTGSLELLRHYQCREN